MSPKVVKGQIWISHYLMTLSLIKKLNRKDLNKGFEIGL
ncbi:unnamed protein product, partial [marine sediment metagenome]